MRNLHLVVVYHVGKVIDRKPIGFDEDEVIHRIRRGGRAEYQVRRLCYVALGIPLRVRNRLLWSEPQTDLETDDMFLAQSIPPCHVFLRQVAASSIIGEKGSLPIQLVTNRLEFIWAAEARVG